MKNRMLVVGVLVLGGVFALSLFELGDRSASRVVAQEAEDKAPQATRDTVESARKVLTHWYELRRRALRDQHKFDADDAWDEAAKEGGFKDHADYEAAIAKQRKADPIYFAKRFSAMRETVQKAHVKAVKADEDGDE